jgi:hypothetical protein
MIRIKQNISTGSSYGSASVLCVGYDVDSEGGGDGGGFDDDEVAFVAL